MRRPRFSIKSLMTAVALLGLVLAAMKRPNVGWAFVLPLVHSTMLLTAVLGALLRRGEKQAFWIGFSLFGWSYGVLLLLWKADAASVHLYPPPHEMLEIPILLMTGNREMWKGIDINPITFESTAQVAASLQGLLFACIGGGIARRFSRTEQAVNG